MKSNFNIKDACASKRCNFIISLITFIESSSLQSPGWFALHQYCCQIDQHHTFYLDTVTAVWHLVTDKGYLTHFHGQISKRMGCAFCFGLMEMEQKFSTFHSLNDHSHFIYAQCLGILSDISIIITLGLKFCQARSLKDVLP